MMSACGAGMPDMAAETAFRGLASNPDDPKLINNLCYALLRAGRVEDAEEAFRKYNQDDDEMKIFYIATKGLLEFKKGNLAEGRNLYSEAMKLCKQKGDRDLAAKAHLNLALAEIEASTHEADKAVHLAISSSENSKDPDVELLRRQVFEKWENKEKARTK